MSSMTVLTIAQTIWVFAAYSITVLLLPALVFAGRFRSYRLPKRLLLYLVTGNFYIINMVLLLGVFRLSYTPVMIAVTVLTGVIGRILTYRYDVRKGFASIMEQARRLSQGTLGSKSAFYRLLLFIKRLLLKLYLWIHRNVFKKLPHAILFGLVIASLCYVYGTNIVNYYGYNASDTAIHNSWINAMGANNLFISGIYPFGFHAIVFFIHKVFLVDTYVVLRVFSFTIVIYVIGAMVLAIRYFTRLRYSVYAVAYFYVLASFFNTKTYNRFYASLPHELAFVFIFPAIFFMLEFCRVRRERKEGRAGIGEEHLVLAALVVAASLTVAVHFYAALVTAIMCGAIVVVYAIPTLRLRGLLKVVCAGALALVLGIFPLLVAYGAGYRVHQSLKWGVRIIKKTILHYDKVEEEEEERTDPDVTYREPSDHNYGQIAADIYGMDIERLAEEAASAVREEMRAESAMRHLALSGKALANEPLAAPTLDTPAVESAPAPESASHQELSPLTRLLLGIDALNESFFEGIRSGWLVTKFAVPHMVFNADCYEYSKNMHWVYFLAIILGIIYIWLKKGFYGQMLLSAGIGGLILFVLPVTGFYFRLPLIIESVRAVMLGTYVTLLPAALVIDGLLCLPLIFEKELSELVKRPVFYLDVASLAVSAGILAVLITTGCVRVPLSSAGDELPTMQQTNEAIACVTNIIGREKDYTWTIVSANDERVLTWDHGYHMELRDFLYDMERLGDSARIQIPTQTVFFFIEKRPIGYNDTYEGLGRTVSPEGAAMPLPEQSGQRSYSGENRYTYMSRMYEWSKLFARMYPNDMRPYMETENFVCYRVDQNPYRLYNFALDYDYNTRDYSELED